MLMLSTQVLTHAIEHRIQCFDHVETIDDHLGMGKTRLRYVAVGLPHVAGDHLDLLAEVLPQRLKMRHKRLFLAAGQDVELDATLQIGQDAYIVPLALAVGDFVDAQLSHLRVTCGQVDLLVGHPVVETLDGLVAQVHQRSDFGERLLGAELEDPLGLAPRVALAGHDPVGLPQEVARACGADELRQTHM